MNCDEDGERVVPACIPGHEFLGSVPVDKCSDGDADRHPWSHLPKDLADRRPTRLHTFPECGNPQRCCAAHLDLVHVVLDPALKVQAANDPAGYDGNDQSHDHTSDEL